MLLEGQLMNVYQHIHFYAPSIAVRYFAAYLFGERGGLNSLTMGKKYTDSIHPFYYGIGYCWQYR